MFDRTVKRRAGKPFRIPAEEFVCPSSPRIVLTESVDSVASHWAAIVVLMVSLWHQPVHRWALLDPVGWQSAF